MKLFKSIVYVAFIGILAHYIGEALPRKYFSDQSFPFRSFDWERNGKVYEALKIKKWKSKLPDMSSVMNDMLPKRIGLDAKSCDIDKLIKETCVAEFVHDILCFFSIGIYFIWKNKTGTYLALFYVACNMPFILIQRYNRPNLVRLRNRLLKREERLSLCDY